MTNSVQDLFGATSDLFRLKILAGRGGLQNQVSWVYYTEDISTLDFIRGGELIITTGLEIERLRRNTGSRNGNDMEDYLVSLVKKLSSVKSSGLILNIGKYILSVPEKLTALCDELNFPLLTMPWEIHIIDIMQDYGKRIFETRARNMTLEKALYNAIFWPDDFDFTFISDYIFCRAKEFFIVLVELPDEFKKKSSEEISRYMEFNFNTKIKILPDEYVMIFHDEKICYILKNDPGLAQDKKFEKARKIESAVRLDRFLKDSRISVSGICRELSSLPAEYRHAEFAMRFCDTENLFSDYKALGVYQLFGEIKDRQILQKFYDDTLGKLNSMGNEKLADYLNTLKLYLETNGSVQKTAEENFTHRNTVNYRIKRICEILNVNLQSDGNARYKIQTALYVKELLSRQI